jgi:hypothetical protein
MDDRSPVKTAVKAQLTLSIGPDRERSVEASRRWIRDAIERLTGRLGDRVRAATPEEIDWFNFEPRRLRAGVGTSGGQVAEWMATYSPSSWDLLMDRLAELPTTGSVEAVTNSELGGFPDDPSFSVGVTRESGDWLKLEADVDVELATEPHGQAIILDVVRRAAERCNPTSGVLFTPENSLQTPLEAGLNLWPYETIPRSREVLRDYGWLTVMAQELGDRLGGLPALRATGAFHQAEQLGAGGYWLLATERWEDYRLEQAERIFEVLAPVLPPGRPDPPEDPANIIVERDPSGRSAE